MALIKCPECSAEISDKAHNCPKCAYPISKPITHNKPPVVVQKEEGCFFLKRGNFN